MALASLKRKLDDLSHGGDGGGGGGRQPLIITSAGCAVHDLDLISVPPSQVLLDDFVDEQLQAFGQAFPVDESEATCIEIRLNPAPKMLTSLFCSSISVTLQVTKADGSNVTDGGANPVLPIAFLGQTMWKNIEVFVNGIKICTQNSFYAYQAYIQTLLFTDETYKRFALGGPQLFLQDAAGAMQDLTGVANKNGGKRAAYCKDSRKFTLTGKLCLELNQTPRLFSGNLEFVFRFFMNNSNFCLMSNRADSSLKLRILDMKMYVRRYRVSNEVLEALHNQLTSVGGHIYPITQLQTRSYVLNEKDTAFTKTLFIQQSPRRIFLFFVNQRSRLGSIQSNPFDLKLFDLSEMVLTVGGVQRPSFTTKFDLASDPDAHTIFHQLQQTLNFDSLTAFDSYGFLNGFVPTHYLTDLFLLLQSKQEHFSVVILDSEFYVPILLLIIQWVVHIIRRRSLGL